MILNNAPGQIQKVIDNPLFGKSDFREDDAFKGLYHEIQEALRKGWKA